MRIIFILFLTVSFLSATAQEERDTILKRCPVYITDTVSSNNFFLEFQPSTLKVDRVRGDLNIVLQQRDQFFTVFFHDKRLSNTTYKIVMGSNKEKHVQAKYSFRSGDQVSYVDVKTGTVESIFDKEKNMWHVKVAGMIANLVERSITYYKVRAEFWLK